MSWLVEYTNSFGHRITHEREFTWPDAATRVAEDLEEVGYTAVRIVEVKK